jgi:hypothetical protein
LPEELRNSSDLLLRVGGDKSSQCRLDRSKQRGDRFDFGSHGSNDNFASISRIVDALDEAPFCQSIDHTSYGAAGQTELTPNLAGRWRTTLHDETESLEIGRRDVEPARDRLAMALLGG